MSKNEVDAKKRPGQLKARRLFRRSWFNWFTGACCVFVAFWAFGGFSALLNRAASEALRERDYERADKILTLTDGFHCETPRTIFLKARLRRKQLRIAEVPELLQAADKAGFDKSLVRREFILLEAQSGGIRHVADELNSMLQQGGEDGAEICEAYVNGAMMIGATEVAMTILPVWKQGENGAWHFYDVCVPKAPSPCSSYRVDLGQRLKGNRKRNPTKLFIR